MKVVRVKIDGTMNDIDVNLKKKILLKYLKVKQSQKEHHNLKNCMFGTMIRRK